METPDSREEGTASLQADRVRIGTWPTIGIVCAPAILGLIVADGNRNWAYEASPMAASAGDVTRHDDIPASFPR